MPSRNLVLAGGCALNCVAIGKALNGMTRYGLCQIMWRCRQCYWCCCGILTKAKLTTSLLGHNIKGKYQSATALMTNKIFGVASGKAEFGPRALGNRSLLADPSEGDETKDRVNPIQKRQEFRSVASYIRRTCK